MVDGVNITSFFSSSGSSNLSRSFGQDADEHFHYVYWSCIAFLGICGVITLYQMAQELYANTCGSKDYGLTRDLEAQHETASRGSSTPTQNGYEQIAEDISSSDCSNGLTK